MMEQAAVVQDADTRDERRSYKDAHNLGARRSVESQEHCDYHGGVHREAAKEWDRCEMNLPRPWQIHHSNAQSQSAHRNNEH